MISAAESLQQAVRMGQTMSGYDFYSHDSMRVVEWITRASSAVATDPEWARAMALQAREELDGMYPSMTLFGRHMLREVTDRLDMAIGQLPSNARP